MLLLKLENKKFRLPTGGPGKQVSGTILTRLNFHHEAFNVVTGVYASEHIFYSAFFLGNPKGLFFLALGSQVPPGMDSVENLLPGNNN